MQHLEPAEVAGVLALILASAKLLGWLAQRIGQPAVLGEMLAGVLLGVSCLGLVDSHNPVLHTLAELGVLLLLFEIGLETKLEKLLEVGGTAAVVALVGVAVPFALGYCVCIALGYETLVAVVAGAALTATSVGITARVLSDLGRLQEPESQIVLGAAVIDDVIGLIILTVVAGLAGGQPLSVSGVAVATLIAFGFIVVTLLVGAWVVPLLFRATAKVDLPGIKVTLALVLALALAWLADTAGSALIIGAFSAGLLLARTPHVHEIEKGVAPLGHFFVPVFFVSVGAAVDLRVFNPVEPANWPTLQLGGLLILAAIIGKLAAGYAPFWFKGKKSVIGVGMVPRGEVGLIFAQKGLDTKVFTSALFSAVALMVMVTTFLAPPLLKLLFPPRPQAPPPPEPTGVADLVTDA